MKIMRFSTAIPAWSTWMLVAITAWTLGSFAPAAAGVPGDPNQKMQEEYAGDHSTADRSYAPSQLVVGLAGGAEPADVFGGGLVSQIAATLDHGQAYLLQLVEGADVDSAAEELGGVESVSYAHPNYLINRLHPVQGSYPFPDVELTGDYEAQLAATSLRLAEAHGSATGSGTTVGIIDVGADFDNPTLAPVTSSGYDFVDDDAVAFDELGGLHSGHGTFVAGVVHLVAPDAQIRAYRIADADGYGDGFTLARAIERAVDDGCDVINLSVVLLKRHLAVRDALLYAEDMGVLVVAAAGNQAKEDLIYPAAEASALAVGAVDPLYQLTPFSTYGSHLSVCAPGSDVYSTFTHDYFAWWSGTSFSAPFVTGLAALLLEASPDASRAMLQGAMEVTALDIDTLNPGREGLAGAGLINPVAALAYMGSPEVATVSPDTVYFEHQVGRQYFVAPFTHVWLQSTNAPATYYAEPAGPDPFFAWVFDSVGVTNDSVMVQIHPIDTPGTFTNTILFHVDDVAEPVPLTVILSVEGPGDTTHFAWAVPNVLYFQAQLGSEVMLSGGAVLQSTNAPAAYTAEVLSGGAQVTTVISASGTTPDSVMVQIDPSLAPAVGMYEDTVSFLVDGVLNPAPLFIMLEIVDSLPPDTVVGPALWIDTASVADGAQVDIALRATSGSTPWGGFDLLLQFDPTLLTYVDASPGEFLVDCGWEHFNAVLVSADSGLVRLVAVADLAGVTGEPLCLSPDPGATLAQLHFQVTEDSGLVCQRAPIRFWWADCGDNAISNETGDTLIIADDTPGTVIDFSGVDITGVPHLGGPPWPCPQGTFAPEPRIRYHNGVVRVNCDTTGVPGATAAVYPDSLYFEWPEGVTPTVLPQATVVITSTNAPASYVAGVLPATPDYTLLLDSTGVTPDSVIILVNPAPLAVGQYVNTVRFWVDGVDAPVDVQVHMRITPEDDTTGTDSAWIQPEILSVTVPPGSSEPITAWAYLASTNAPAVYSGFVLGFPSFALLPDSVGQTNDSVAVIFDPTGYAPGTHYDSVVFDVGGIGDPVLLFVQLHIGAGDTVMSNSVYSYPNPFNPETQIAFTLRQAAHVEIQVFNILGARVRVVADEFLAAGEHRRTWDGRNGSGERVASGVYFYRLRVGSDVHTGKMLMVR